MWEPGCKKTQIDSTLIPSPFNYHMYNMILAKYPNPHHEAHAFNARINPSTIYFPLCFWQKRSQSAGCTPSPNQPLYSQAPKHQITRPFQLAPSTHDGPDVTAQVGKMVALGDVGRDGEFVFNIR